MSTASNSRGFTSADPPRSGDSLIHLLKELRDETMALFRQEVELAKTEASQKVARVGRNVAYIAAGGAIAMLGSIFLVASLAFLAYVGLRAVGLSFGVACWLAPLAVGVVLAGIGATLLMKALATLKHESILPRKTVETIKEDKQWLVQKTR